MSDIKTGQPKPLNKRVNKILKKMTNLMFTKDQNRRPNAETLIDILNREYVEPTDIYDGVLFQRKDLPHYMSIIKKLDI